jgi:LysM repeat protein
MIGTKGIAILMALGVGLLAGLGGLYLYQQGQGLPFGAGPETAAPGEGSPAAPASQAAAPAEATPKAQAGASAGVKPDAEPTTVPSFDVVMIEPNGEGVIAGRAAPGWQVSVQSGGAKVAGATADAQGEWSAVLDKPLPAGDHALTLKITSPDGTRALSSQELVRVEVGDAAKPAAPPATTAAITPPAPPPAAAPSAEAAAPAPQSPPPAVAPSTSAPSVEPSAAPSQQALALAEPQGEVRALPRTAEEGTVAQPAKPKLVFKTVDYQDTGSAIGSVSITGISDPGATVTVYCNNEKLATVRAGADGTWSVVAEKKLGTGQHSFRAEQIDAATGTALAQANVAIERLVPKPPEVVAKAATPKPGSPAASVAAVETKEVYTIRRGDTLWAIAKRYLGSGLRYTRIFQDNREVINDPDLILPQQQVKVPPAQQ